MNKTLSGNMLREFRGESFARSLALVCFGGGHTIQTDPCSRGWRLKGVPNRTDVAILGKIGSRGCFSIMQTATDLDVAYYAEMTPAEVIAGFKDGTAAANAVYHSSDFYSGWALPLISMAESDERNRS